MMFGGNYNKVRALLLLYEAVGERRLNINVKTEIVIVYILFQEIIL